MATAPALKTIESTELELVEKFRVLVRSFEQTNPLKKIKNCNMTINEDGVISYDISFRDAGTTTVATNGVPLTSSS